MKHLFLIFLSFVTLQTKAQNGNDLLAKAVEKVYSEYKMFLDSSLLPKHIILDTKKSYWVNSKNQTIKSIIKGWDNFSFDEFSLSFAVVYKGDTIRHLPVCRLNTQLVLMVLGSPGNPQQHGDVLPPYAQLIKGNIDFNYKKLQKLLRKMELETTAVNLQKITTAQNQANKQNAKQEYEWIVTTACPEVKCRQLKISASSGKIIEDKAP